MESPYPLDQIASFLGSIFLRLRTYDEVHHTNEGRANAWNIRRVKAEHVWVGAFRQYEGQSVCDLFSTQLWTVYKTIALDPENISF